MTSKLTKYALLAAACGVFASMTSCMNDDESTWDTYKDWRETNNHWLDSLQNLKNADGTPYYSTVVPAWNTNSYIMMRKIDNNNPEAATNPFYPIFTSTVDVIYELHLADGTQADTSVGLTTWGTDIYRSTLNSSSLISGWSTAILNMCVGDSCEFIIPYDMAYGENSTGSVLPYSNLRFNIRLVDIPYYELKP